jgi:hypothetical protein
VIKVKKIVTMTPGNGTMEFPDGRVLKGHWNDGELNGLGTFLWANGDRYEGNFENSSRSGQGTFFYNNGDIYTGQWKMDKKVSHWGSFYLRYINCNPIS